MNLTSLIRAAETSLTPEMKEALDNVYGGNIVGNDSLSDRVAFGLEVTLIGMGVVFGVLLLLIGVLQVFKLFAKKKPKPVETKEAVSAPAPVVAVPVTAPTPASEEETIVAIATAAIAASRGESEAAFKVLSIKKIVK